MGRKSISANLHFCSEAVNTPTTTLRRQDTCLLTEHAFAFRSTALFGQKGTDLLEDTSATHNPRLRAPHTRERNTQLRLHCEKAVWDAFQTGASVGFPRLEAPTVRPFLQACHTDVKGRLNKPPFWPEDVTNRNLSDLRGGQQSRNRMHVCKSRQTLKKPHIQMHSPQIPTILDSHILVHKLFTASNSTSRTRVVVQVAAPLGTARVRS